jgi:hypothetical protein
MSQRLIEERQRRILGITAAGKLIPVISGSDSAPLSDPTLNPPVEAPPVDPASGGTGVLDPAAAPPAGKTYSEAEYAALQRRMQAADGTAAQYQAKLKEFEDANKSEIERAQSAAQEAIARAEAAEQALLQEKVNNAFLISNKHTWHDPETALQLLDQSAIEIADDGSVRGIDAAIEALAKQKPFLINTAANTQPAPPKTNGGTPTGHQPSKSQKPVDSKEENRKKLLAKYQNLSR